MVHFKKNTHEIAWSFSFEQLIFHRVSLAAKGTILRTKYIEPIAFTVDTNKA